MTPHLVGTLQVERANSSSTNVGEKKHRLVLSKLLCLVDEISL